MAKVKQQNTYESVNKSFNSLSADIPITAFPVRIETHFRDATAGNKKVTQLCVRIFPDQIFIHQNDMEEITNDEYEDGKRFWAQWYVVSQDSELAFDAWKSFCRKYNVSRAAWIADKVKPSPRRIDRLVNYIFEKKSDQRINPSPQEIAKKINILLLSNELDFTPIEKFREPNAFSKPISNILPDCFVLYGKYSTGNNQKEQEIKATGNNIDPNLQLSFDINEKLESGIPPYVVNKETGDMKVEGGLKWLTDYNEAVEKGMAITYTFDQKHETISIPYLYVYGVKTRGYDIDPNDSEQDRRIRFMDMLKYHLYYGDGFDLLKIGTPTNSLEGIDSGYTTDTEHIMSVFYEFLKKGRIVEEQVVPEAFVEEIEIEKKEDDYFKSDISVLLHAFGISNKEKLWIEHYENQETESASLINRAVLKPIVDRIFRGNSHFDSSFIDYLYPYVLGRGYIPPFRIGNNPYSILPITDFDPKNFKFSGNVKEAEKMEIFSKVLWALAELFKEILRKEENSPIDISKINKNKAADKSIEMMGQTPVSVGWYLRQMIENTDVLSPSLATAKLYSLTLNARNKKFITYLNSLCGTKYKNIADFFNVLPHAIQETISELTAEELSTIFKGIKYIEEEKDGVMTQYEMPEFNPDQHHLLIGEVMDLLTHRLDAWFMGILNYWIATRKPVSPYIGAWGWVFDLNKKTEAEKKSDNEFILAPSINQAITAAVLRSSYRRSKDPRLCINLNSARVRKAMRLIDGIRGGLSVGAVLGADFERVIHDAYKINSKHELDRYILPLRVCFPLNLATEDAQANESKEEASNSYLMSVVNFELLLDTFYDDWQKQTLSISDYLVQNNIIQSWFDNAIRSDQEHNGWILSTIQGDPNNQSSFMRIAQLVEEVADSYDAYSDVVVSEGVYQLVSGNRVAFVAALRSIAEGKMPPYPTITEIPMDSAYFSVKTAIAFPCEEYSAEGVMAKLQPELNEWITRQIGDLNQIFYCLKSENETATYTVGELGISALEYLYLSSNMDSFKRFILLSHNNTSDETFEVDIRAEMLQNGERTMFQTSLLLDSLRPLLQTARMLTADHFRYTPITEEDGSTYTEADISGVDVSDLAKNVDYLMSYCNDKILCEADYFIKYEEKEDGNHVLYMDYTEDDFPKMLNILRECYLLGMSNALSSWSYLLIQQLPKELDDNQQTDFLSEKQNKTKIFIDNFIQTIVQLKTNIDQAEKIKEKIIKYSSQVSTLEKEIDSCNQNLWKTKRGESESITLESRISDLTQQLEDLQNSFSAMTQLDVYTQMIHSILPASFKVLSKFKLDTLSSDDFLDMQEQMKPEFHYRNVSSLEIEEWMEETAKVREPMQHLHAVKLFREAHDMELSETAVLQMPFSEYRCLQCGNISNKKENSCSFCGSENNLQKTFKEHEWLGCELTDESLLEDKDSIVILEKESLKIEEGQYNCGILLDNWLELIPYRKQQGGIVFHCDQPDAEAPNVILYAIHPSAKESNVWTSKNVEDIIMEAHFMTKLRTIEPDHLYQDPVLSTILPLTIIPNHKL